MYAGECGGVAVGAAVLRCNEKVFRCSAVRACRVVCVPAPVGALVEIM